MGLDFCRAVGRDGHAASVASTPSSTATTATMRSPEPAKAQLQERVFTHKANGSTYYYSDAPPPETHNNIKSETRQGEREHSPVTLRWESPKSTIQLEDLLFGIGSQFDDMALSPKQLSHMRAVCDHDRDDSNRLIPPSSPFSSSMAAVRRSTGEGVAA